MRQTLQDAYNVAISTNLQYDRNQEIWEYLLQSYVGGNTYRSSGHLTRYALETDDEYNARLNETPLDNHCQSVISVFTSFLFKESPHREFGTFEGDPVLKDILKDADYEGRSFDNFMKEVSIWSSVFGHCYVIASKPKIGAQTRAEELEEGVRPYLSLLTPLTVLDWNWNRTRSGRYIMDYIKYIEDVNDDETAIVEWTPEIIKTTVVNTDKKSVIEEYIEENELGKLPVVIAYNKRSPVRGIGVSDIEDIADHQRKIYNELSEVAQSIRINGHPALVKTPSVEAVGGAGAIVSMPEDLDPGLKPYMLGVETNTAAIYESIQESVNAINKMANVGAVRETESRTMSGVSRETEFALLNARLSEKADNLESAEEQLWKLIAQYQNRQFDGEINYPNSFNIRDKDREYQQLQQAKNIASDPAIARTIDEELLELLGYEVEEVLSEDAFTPHIMYNNQTGEQRVAATEAEHLALAAQGWTHEGE